MDSEPLVEIPFPAADYLALVRAHGHRLAEAAGSVPLDTTVPTCPGWTLRDLVRHTESVYRHKTETIRGDWRHESAPRVQLPDDTDVASFRTALAEMLDVFASADMSVPSWTWCPHEHRAEWWARRMAHETLIHGADALVATGGTPAAEPWLALDGIDEILDEMIMGRPPWATLTPGSSRIDLVADGRRWPLRFGRLQGTSPSGKSVDRDTVIFDAAGPPDAVVTADPATLDIWLWGRGPLPASAQQGEVATVSRLRSVAAAAT